MNIFLYKTSPVHDCLQQPRPPWPQMAAALTSVTLHAGRCFAALATSWRDKKHPPVCISTSCSCPRGTTSDDGFISLLKHGQYASRRSALPEEVKWKRAKLTCFCTVSLLTCRCSSSQQDAQLFIFSATGHLNDWLRLTDSSVSDTRMIMCFCERLTSWKELKAATASVMLANLYVC